MSAHQESSDEDTARSHAIAISDSTPVRLGLIICLLGICAAGFGGWIWWAATISAKMDVLLTQQGAMVQTSNGHSKDIEELKSWRKMIDSVGTPAMMAKTDDLEKKVQELSRQFELHKATTTTIKNNP